MSHGAFRGPDPPRAARIRARRDGADAERGAHDRFAFFGVMTPFKGIDVLLKAMEQLGPDFDGELTIHGANYEDQPEDVRQELDRLMEATQATVKYDGPYDHDRTCHA